jgi:hypothetical protein
MHPITRQEVARYRQVDMLREAQRERLGRELVRAAKRDRIRRRIFRWRRREQQPALEPALER